MDQQTPLIYAGQSSSGRFSSQPHNVSVTEGSEARFSCTYDSSSVVPIWIINGLSYTWTSLPEKHTFNGHQIIIESVDTSMNGSTYQCVIPGVSQSTVGSLTVLTGTDSVPGFNNHSITSFSSSSLIIPSMIILFSEFSHAHLTILTVS